MTGTQPEGWFSTITKPRRHLIATLGGMDLVHRRIDGQRTPVARRSRPRSDCDGGRRQLVHLDDEELSQCTPSQR
jgi:hypothetical protein